MIIIFCEVGVILRVLVTGENSYIGKMFAKWVYSFPDTLEITFISLRNDDWVKQDFSVFDVVFHVAAIVHEKEKTKLRTLYFRINKELPILIAKKAKNAGVKQFIFMSTLSVYGLDGLIGGQNVINLDTLCHPKSFYGRSKLEAEIELKKISDDTFKLVIIRAPMVYGPDSPGNYKRLRKFILKSPVFPAIDNSRSMIYIDNLSEFIRLIIINQESGLFIPQNQEFINVVEMASLISMSNHKKIAFSKVLAHVIYLIGNHSGLLRRVFGNLTVEKELSVFEKYKYSNFSLKQSINTCETNVVNRPM
ncbi:NAD-dependent epimerase/dehydratase family protein [Cohnella lupini]|uniref:UDP-glucose 4-epimerase n=1 Tax=Cohnella lupini TaxID=1294267 RepID=A0A3D9IVU4_9BACL|nr:NAD-dependent epimerase/dehydratase family protein [Cohnella lupini]RED65815.1 UDP-glucose 4-epimerase [Cohnella lupini]